MCEQRSQQKIRKYHNESKTNSKMKEIAIENLLDVFNNILEIEEESNDL